MEIIAFFWFGFAIIVGVAANTRGRSGFGWFLLALIISPLLAGLLVLAMPHKRAGVVDLATMAAVEATPIGSQSRQMLAHEMQKEKEKRDFKRLVIIIAIILLGLLWLTGNLSLQ